MPVDFSRITDAQWRSLDDTAVARLAGCTKGTAALKRKQLGHPKVRKKGSGRKGINLKRFNLKLTNKQNAEALGITPQRASQIRKQLTQEEWV